MFQSWDEGDMSFRWFIQSWDDDVVTFRLVYQVGFIRSPGSVFMGLGVSFM